jgi:hypothetical protein
MEEDDMVVSGHEASTPYEPAAPPMEIELDRLDLAALLPVGLRPSALPCGRCGVRQGHHGRSGACPAYVRPDLPAGFAFADRLRVGQAFRFLPETGSDCVRRVTATGCCAMGELTALTSAAEGCGPATHWVQGSLVVAVERQALAAPTPTGSSSVARSAASRGAR